MADWDEESPRLRDNLRAVLRDIRDEAYQRAPLNLEELRNWHRRIMSGLHTPNLSWIGRFRGEKGLDNLGVRVGRHRGTAASQVANELTEFEQRLVRVIEHMDSMIAPGSELSTDQIEAVLEVCAWAHSEWVRVHPFANGNGRTARLLANAIALRYGLPPFVRLRPQPNHGYPNAAEASMRGDYQPLVISFHRMLDACLSGET